MIRIAHIAPNVRTLGPGQRFCLWVQGCQRRCPGCMSAETWAMDGGTLMDEATLVERMRGFDFEGVTISGGEPMLQCAALVRLIDLLRAERDAGVLVYTGFTLEALRARRDEATDALLSRIDLLIDGSYEAGRDDGGAWRGSANQRAWCLTDRYRAAVAETFGRPGARRQELHIDDQGVLLVGLRDNGVQAGKGENA